MFLGSMIYQKRVSKQLTQTELAHDICTQNTVSKIEKHNTAPTVNILLKLCLRLDLTLNDVFTDFNTITQSNVQNVINDLEKLVLAGHTKEVSEQFKLVGEDNIGEIQQGQYFVIEGAIQYLSEKYDEATFTLDKALQQTKSDTYNVYTILAYLYEGLSYSKLDYVDRAQYYFELARNAVSDSVDIPNANLDERLFICKTLAEFYTDSGDTENAGEFTRRGFSIIKKEHEVPFVADFYHLAASQVQDKTSQNYRDNVEAEKFFRKIFGY